MLYCLPSSAGLLALPLVYPTASPSFKKKKVGVALKSHEELNSCNINSIICRVISRNNDGLDEIDNLILTP